MYSTAAQISGAVTNIVLDAVFIFVFGWGVAGAAWATVIGQIISLLIAMILHYNTNKEVDGEALNILNPRGILLKKYTG